MNRDGMQTRTISAQWETRDENDEPVIEGYFAVIGIETELWPGAFEEIGIGAFDGTLGNDIRALNNHDTALVLGRNRAGTLELRNNSHGLWGRIQINRKDTDALNLYERVKRGDVSQCSFGFNILKESTDYREDGTIKWTIEEIDLHEVSVVTFPAYSDTGVQARKVELEQYQQRRLDQRKHEMKVRLQNGTQTTDAGKETGTAKGGT